jgi:hypothetical protein
VLAKPDLFELSHDAVTLVADSILFVDDIRPTGPTEADARQASQVVAKQAAWREIKDATRKQRDVSQTTGASAGSVVHTADGDVSTMVEQTKWVKAKAKPLRPGC